MNTEWIKRSEQEPVQTDAPVMYGYWCDDQWIESSAHNVWGNNRNPEYTHWRSIKVPPPPRELTQRVKDVNLIRSVDCEFNSKTTRELMLEAIYAERREMTRLMDGLWPEGKWGRDDSYNSQCKAIRARLDEQGGGK